MPPADSRPPSVPRQLQAAIAVVLVQAVVLVGVGIFLIVKTAVGTPSTVAGALFGAGFAFLFAAIFALGARGMSRLQPAARAPVVVLELLSLPVGYSLGIQAGLIQYGGPVLVLALAVLYFLATPPARLALDRYRDDDQAG